MHVGVVKSRLLVLLQIVELDNTNQAPEVLFSSYSGGMHCCAAITIFSQDEHENWQHTKLDGVDGYPIGATTIDGVDYIFMDKDKFNQFVKFGEFVENEWVHGYQYGTLIRPIEDALDKKEITLLDVDVKGGFNIRDEFEDQVISIFIEPPGENVSDQLLVLEERLNKRGDENSTLIKQRLRRFENEMTYKKRFEHHFINDDYDETVNEIEKTIKRNIK